MRALPLCTGRFSEVSRKPRTDCVLCSRRWAAAQGEPVQPTPPQLPLADGGSCCPARVRLAVDFVLLPDALSNKASVSPAPGLAPGAGGTSFI